MWVIQGIGSGIEHDYAGVVEDSFELRVGDSVKYVLSVLGKIYCILTFLLIGN